MTLYSQFKLNLLSVWLKIGIVENQLKKTKNIKNFNFLKSSFAKYKEENFKYVVWNLRKNNFLFKKKYI